MYYHKKDQISWLQLDIQSSNGDQEDKMDKAKTRPRLGKEDKEKVIAEDKKQWVIYEGNGDDQWNAWEVAITGEVFDLQQTPWSSTS